MLLSSSYSVLKKDLKSEKTRNKILNDKIKKISMNNMQFADYEVCK